MVFIRSLRLANFLSFGPDAEPVELGPLNVLVGPNGSGKSNFLEALSLLRAFATPGSLASVIRDGGGISEWSWKGRSSQRIEIEASIDQGSLPSARSQDLGHLRHALSFTEVGQRFEIVDERVEHAVAAPGRPKPYLYFGYENGRPKINRGGTTRKLTREAVNPEDSILAQRRDPDVYPEITRLASLYGAIRLYREWSFGRGATFRAPERTDLPNDFLAPDISNVTMVLNALRGRPAVKRRIVEYLNRLAERFDDFDTRVEGGTIQLFLHERDWVVPATRLSDGTLRYLCLLAILLHPDPPPLVAIEEPELGLHPDMMPTLAELLVDASSRTQLVVTTHSDTLVDALSEVPDALVVCERNDGVTTMRRLDPLRMRGWIEHYSLGKLWRSGEIGGNRW